MSETTTATKTTRTRKAPAKDTPDVVNHETGQTADEVKTVWLATAQGRAGKVNTRRFPQAMNWAADVADADAKTEAGRKGLIFRFFATEDKATAYIDKMNAAGYDAKLVPATSELAK